MPELLIELFSEEIPARMQRKAAEGLKKAVTDALVEAGLLYESAAAFVTPRRLALTITGLPPASPDTREERKGPRVGAPAQAVEGFLKAAGLKSLDQAKIETDPKKGEFYVAIVEKKGAPAPQILAETLPKIIAGFEWPKSMRWGDGRLNWVRPLRGIVATFGTDNDEPEIIPFEADGLASGQITHGHRFMAPRAIKVRRFDDYVQALEKAKVILDLDRRKDIIKNDAEHLAFAQGLTLIEDAALLEEVAGLVEWPVVLMGSFDPDFLKLPEEVIIATIRANQKCFCLRDKKTGKLANKFILTSNMIADDGGATIIAGNERVIRARLSDALFFYNTDLATKLGDYVPKLKDIVFHAKLGTQGQRVERLIKLAGEIAPQVGADPAGARHAAKLAKADLTTGMVGEFPELQGLMGRYYAAAQGEKPAIAHAIEMHYKPLGPSDAVPTEPVSIAVALADKLDILTGFWAIDEKPTGSRDPYALRRAALGVIRILVDNKIKLPLRELLASGRMLHKVNVPYPVAQSDTVRGAVESAYNAVFLRDLFNFFVDRLKVQLRDRGNRFDLVDAVFVATDELVILSLTQRVEALSELLSSEDGKNLLVGYRRGVNILAAEEKKDGQAYAGDIDKNRLKLAEELNLAAAIDKANASASQAISANNYKAAIEALSALRGPVDAFFEKVLVNDDDKSIRANRLGLLARLRDTMHLVADFSKVEG